MSIFQTLRNVVVLLALAALCSAAEAQNLQSVRINGPYLPNGYCQFTASTAALLSASCTIAQRTTIALICIETANVRYRDDGTDPTTTVGMPVTAGTCFQYAGDFTSIRFVAVSGSPVVNVSFYR